MEPTINLTGSALVSVLIVPTIQYAKKHWKLVREVPMVAFVLMGILVYGVSVLYQGVVFGSWEFASANIINTAIMNGLLAVGIKVGLKTVGKIKK